MSLAIGQSEGYINSIENKNILPSMQVFLYICEYLEITPRDFFDEDFRYPPKADEIYNAIKRLSKEQQKLITELIREMK